MFVPPPGLRRAPRPRADLAGGLRRADWETRLSCGGWVAVPPTRDRGVVLPPELDLLAAVDLLDRAAALDAALCADAVLLRRSFSICSSSCCSTANSSWRFWLAASACSLAKNVSSAI